MTQMTEASTVDLLTALSIPRIGPGYVRKRVTTASSALALSPTTSDVFAQIVDEHDADTVVRARQAAESTLDLCASLGVSVVPFFDERYPQQLMDIRDWPVVLYVRGAVEALRSPLVAVVGTRKPSHVGRMYATRIARELAEAGVGVVSGLALGIDTAAHEGALKVRGRTVAVLAHGLDTISPKSNTGLAERIVECSGALVSEHGPGVPARPPEFVRRNRIQSGLAKASVVVESGATGGSIHQARFTHEQGRKLYVFVPPPDAPQRGTFCGAGADRLMIELNAVPISSSGDLRSVTLAA